MIISGFSGIGVIIRGGMSQSPFRFLSADINLSQNINIYLPSYGGENLRRIISPNIGTISGRVSLIPTASSSAMFYNIVKDFEPVDVKLYYYSGRNRSFTTCFLDNLTFSCKAGEMVNLSFDVVCEGEDFESNSKRYTVAEKLVTWDKTGITGFPLSATEDLNSFTYSVKNNLVLIRTAEGLLPRKYGKGIQEVSGNLTYFSSIDSLREPSRLNKYKIQVSNAVTFYVDDFSVTHKIANHWTYKTPLSPGIVITTLDWTRVDDI
jgi:hypothetical protein